MKKLNAEMPKRLDYNERLETLAKWNWLHKELLEASKNAGCYYCCNIFDADTIKEWCDNGKTALCPKCGIDAVIPDLKVKLSLELLREMERYWFSMGGILIKMKDGDIVDIIDEGSKYDPQEFEKYRLNELENYRNRKSEK